MKIKRFWSKVNTAILDDPKWGTLSDSEWRKNFEAIIHDENNIHYDVEFQEYRREFNAARPRIKKLLFSRDPHKCAMCGSTERLEIDHIIPLARGGSNDPDNLQILCRHCNRRKWMNL